MVNKIVNKCRDNNSELSNNKGVFNYINEKKRTKQNKTKLNQIKKKKKKKK